MGNKIGADEFSQEPFPVSQLKSIMRPKPPYKKEFRLADARRYTLLPVAALLMVAGLKSKSYVESLESKFEDFTKSEADFDSVREDLGGCDSLDDLYESIPVGGFLKHHGLMEPLQKLVELFYDMRGISSIERESRAMIERGDFYKLGALYNVANKMVVDASKKSSGLQKFPNGEFDMRYLTEYRNCINLSISSPNYNANRNNPNNRNFRANQQRGRGRGRGQDFQRGYGRPWGRGSNRGGNRGRRF